MRSIRKGDADYLQLLASETEAVLVFGDTIEGCNARALSLLRCQQADVVGQPLERCLPPHQPDGTVSNDGLRLRMEAARAGMSQWFSWQFRCPNGLTVETLVQLELVELDGQPRCIARLSDLSRLRHAEQALQETESRLRQILEYSPTVVFVKDTEGRYLFVNQRFREVFPAAGGGYAIHDTDVFPPQVIDHL